MGKYKYTEIEQKNINELKHHEVELNNLLSKDKEETVIKEYSAKKQYEFEDLFSEEELKKNEEDIAKLYSEYNQIHKLDKIDIAICALASVVSSAVDLLLIGTPQRGKEGLEAKALSDHIRKKFDEIFPEEKMKELANSKNSKVPYDAQDNRNTNIRVEGLSSYMHREITPGHDTILGFVVGVHDIMTGKMTTIDKNGKLVSQIMENYQDRKEVNLIKALDKQFKHLESDVTTSMGLPAPLMCLFNLFQFGSIGEEEQTIAEIVQGMYYEGYDFIHFCSQSISVMIIEVMVRTLYALKRIKEGHSIKESIPFSLNREKHPKLSTMLFIAHAGAAATNAGKVYCTKNPMDINYPQWIVFLKHTYRQLKWNLIQKPFFRHKYVEEKNNEKLKNVYDKIDKTYEEVCEKNIDKKSCL